MAAVLQRGDQKQRECGTCTFSLANLAEDPERNLNPLKGQLVAALPCLPRHSRCHYQSDDEVERCDRFRGTARGSSLVQLLLRLKGRRLRVFRSLSWR